MTRILGFVFFALLASPAIGIAVYGVTFTDWPRQPLGNGVEERVSFEEEQVSAIAGKANKQEVKAVAASGGANEAMAPRSVAGAAEKEEVKAIAAPNMRWAPADATVKEDVDDVAVSHVADEDLRQPPRTRAAVKAKPASVSRVEKKSTSKQKSAKTRNRDSVKISVPLVLIPPQKVGDQRQSLEPLRGTNKSIKPVSEEPGKIIQNFGAPESNEHFRRK